MKWFFILLMGWSLFTQAQVKYNYVEDHQFTLAKDLAGYTFIPFQGKLRNAHFEDPVKAGLVQFKITTTGVEIIERVTFSTSGIEGENKSNPFKMSIPRINKKKYGFELILMDMKNPDIQGYIQFYATKGYIHTIKYKSEPSAAERTYFVAPLPQYQADRDKKYYSHDNDYKIEDFKQLYGQRIYPFAALQDKYDYREYSRIFPKDQIYFEVEERVVTKKKKEKEVQYLVINDPKNKETPKIEFLIKKVKNIHWKDHIYRREREAILVIMMDEVTKTKHEIYCYRHPNKKTLTAIRYLDKEYILRKGKRS